MVVRHCRDSVYIRELPHSPGTYNLGMDPLRLALGQDLISIRTLPNLLMSHIKAYDLESSSADKPPTMTCVWNGFNSVPTMIPSCVVSTSLLQWGRMRQSAREALRARLGQHYDNFHVPLARVPVIQFGSDFVPPEPLHAAPQPVPPILPEPVHVPGGGELNAPSPSPTLSVSPKSPPVPIKRSTALIPVVQTPSDDKIPRYLYLIKRWFFLIFSQETFYFQHENIAQQEGPVWPT